MLDLTNFFLEKAPSDLLLLASAVLALVFFIDYAAFSPWYKIRQHGWIGVMTALHSFAVAALLFLIGWAIVFGEKVTEYVRLPIAFLLFAALITKLVILHTERRIGSHSRRSADLYESEGNA